jgi:hypothetical protein
MLGFGTKKIKTRVLLGSSEKNRFPLLQTCPFLLFADRSVVIVV